MTPNENLYSKFLDFVRDDHQKDRAVDNRRMLSVFIWCFLAPAIVSIVTILLINYSILPRSMRGYLDWIVLIFPVLYSIYFLGSQVLSGLPIAFKRGGFAMGLAQTKKESDWRFKLSEKLHKEMKLSQSDWNWIVQNLEEDLDRMQVKTRYLTALAGAVFFLLMQGIDSITTDSQVIEATTSSAASEWISLFLFLVLLYMSGQQSYYSLKRYLACAKLSRDFFKS
jgi:hypothetical protein